MIGTRKYPERIPSQTTPDDVVEKCAIDLKPLYASDAQADAILSSSKDLDRMAEPRFVSREEILSSAVIPLMHDQGGLLGILFVSYRKKVDFETEPNLKEGIESFATYAAIALETARLLQQEKHLALLKNVGKISATLGLRDALEHIARGAVELISVNSTGIIHLIDAAGENIFSSYQSNEAFYHNPRFSQKEGLTWEIFSTGEIKEVTDVSNSQYVSESMKSSGIQSIIGVPLKLGNQVIGVLYIKTFEEHKFIDHERTALTVLCEHAALAIGKATRYEHLDLLRKVSSKISSTLDQKQVMEFILDGAIRLMGAAFGDIHLIYLDPLRIDESIEVPTGYHPEPRLDNEHSLTRTIIKTLRPIIIGDVTKDPRVNPVLIERGIRSLIGVPLTLRGRINGVLYLNFGKPHQCTDEETTLLLALADQAAISIGNARSFHDCEQTVQVRTKELREAQTRTKSSLDALVGMARQSSIRSSKGKIIELICDFSSDLVDNASMYVVLCDESGSVFDFQFVREEGNIIKTDGYTRSQDELCIAEIIKTRQPVRKCSAFASWIGVPLMVGSGDTAKLFGAVVVYHSTRNVYNNDDVEILQAVANMATTALENIRLHEASRLLQREAHQRDMMTTLGQIASNMAHEFKTPLGLIKGHAQLILRDNAMGRQEIDETLAMMINRVNIMRGQIKQLNDLATGNQLEMELISLGSVIKSAFELCADQLKNRSVLVSLDLQDDTPKVRANKYRLTQLFVNLIQNAIDAFEKVDERKRAVAVKTSHHPIGDYPYVAVLFSDTGPGIPQQDRDRIFRPFASTKVPGQWMGLGLSIVSNIIAELHGKIELVDASVGASFRITIPAKTQRSTDEQAQ